MGFKKNRVPNDFFYVFIVPGSILRHLGEVRIIRLLPGGINTIFTGGSVWILINFGHHTCNCYNSKTDEIIF